MTAWLISQAWPYIIGLVALVWAYGRGKAKERGEQNAEAMKRMIRRTAKRQEIDDAIDQDTDLVSRARAAGVVRHAEH